MTFPSSRRNLLASLIPLVSLSSAAAQVDLDWTYVTPLLIDARNLVWSDIDGDGLEDILVAGELDRVIAWSRNLGGGEFGQLNVIDSGTLKVRCMLAFDVDGDGVKDIVANDYLGVGIVWYRGLGSGEFDQSELIGPSDLHAWELVASDIDLDGDLDLVAAIGGSFGASWLENLGGGSFSAPQLIFSGGPAQNLRSVAVADADLDGDPDVAIADYSANAILVAENLGGGTFDTPVVVASNIGEASAVAFGDFDGDGHQDLIASGRGRVVWIEHAGGSGFQWIEQDRGLVPQPTVAISIADLDGDLIDEMVFADSFFNVRVYDVDIANNTITANPLVTELRTFGRVVPADVDGDGLLDLVAPRNPGEVVYGLSGGGYTLERSPVLSRIGGVQNYLAADIDSDGDLDILAESMYSSSSNGSSNAVVMYERVSDQNFAAPRFLVDPTESARSPGLADLNGDGIDDLHFTRGSSSGGPNGDSLRVRFGIGGGAFGGEQTLAVLPGPQEGPARAIDTDSDGDLDLVMALNGSAPGQTGSIYVYLNDGTGQVIGRSLVAQEPRLSLRQVADIDGDGQLDLLATSEAAVARVFHGDSSAATGFAPPVSTPAGLPGSVIDLTSMDYDGDGDRDLLVAYDPTNSPVDRILAYENMGTAFVSPQPLAVLNVRELPSPVDWDGDGDEDLVFREAFTSNVRWLESDPSGLPALATAFEIPFGVEVGSTAQLTFQDADADGDVDAWVLGIKVLRYLQNGREYGSSVCAGNPNSTGAGAAIAASGTDNAMSNGLVLTSSGLPSGSTTFFLVSRTTGMSQPATSQGTLCLGGAIGRYSRPEQIRTASQDGVARLALDLTMTPDPATGVGAAVAGETLNFQGWYRDANPMVTSNFTAAVGVLLR